MLATVVDHPLALANQPPAKHALRFLKVWLGKLERVGTVDCSELYERIAVLVVRRVMHRNGTSGQQLRPHRHMHMHMHSVCLSLFLVHFNNLPSPPPYFHSDHLVGVSCTRSCAMCKVGNTDVEGWCYKSYWLSANAAITLHESTKMVSAATTGLCTWNGALTLAEWVLEHRSVFAGKCVVELGSGIGLASTTYTHRHVYT